LRASANIGTEVTRGYYLIWNTLSVDDDSVFNELIEMGQVKNQSYEVVELLKKLSHCSALSVPI